MHSLHNLLLLVHKYNIVLMIFLFISVYPQHTVITSISRGRSSSLLSLIFRFFSLCDCKFSVVTKGKRSTVTVRINVEVNLVRAWFVTSKLRHGNENNRNRFYWMYVDSLHRREERVFRLFDLSCRLPLYFHTCPFLLFIYLFIYLFYSAKLVTQDRTTFFKSNYSGGVCLHFEHYFFNRP